MKILLADDHALFRDALIQYIAHADPELHITAVSSFHEVKEILQDDPVQDLVLLDLRMTGMMCMEGMKYMRETYKDIPVALISGVAEMRDVKAAMDLGAVGYFPKTLPAKSMLKALHLVLAGEKYIPIDYETNKIMPSYFNGPDICEKETTGVISQKKSQDIFSHGDIKFTPREREVLSYLLKGASNKEIANELGLQVVTVKLHVRGLCRKLGANNRTQAALKAQEMGLDS